jgi:hypothetical protein
MHWTDKALLSIPETAEALGVSRATVRRLIADWAFGNPDKLADVGTGEHRYLMIPTSRLIPFVEHGTREFPPGDPRGTAGTRSRPRTAIVRRSELGDDWTAQAHLPDGA